MRWRVWSAGLVFGVGVLLWADDISQLEGSAWPPPGKSSTPTQSEELIRQIKARDNRFPTQGLVGFRDEFNGSDEAGKDTNHHYFVLLRYAFAPLLIDIGGAYPDTIVLTSKGTLRFEQRKTRP